MQMNLSSLLALLIGSVGAFVPSGHKTCLKHSVSQRPNTDFLASPPSMPSSLLVLSNDKGNKSGDGDGDMRNRRSLVTESIAPFRGLRLFLYGSLGSGAFIGGLINGSGAIANSNNPEFNLNTEVS